MYTDSYLDTDSWFDKFHILNLEEPESPDGDGVGVGVGPGLRFEPGAGVGHTRLN